MEFSTESQKILDKIHQRRHEIIEIREDRTQLLICTLADHLYAMYGSILKEIGPVEAVTYVPGLPNYFLGLFNLRGDIYSMLDLRRVLKLKESPLTAKSRFIITQVSDLSTGILVDSVQDVVEIETRKIISVPPGEDIIDRYVVAEVEYDQESVALLDVNKIIRDIIKQNE